MLQNIQGVQVNFVLKVVELGRGGFADGHYLDATSTLPQLYRDTTSALPRLKCLHYYNYLFILCMNGMN